MGLLAWAIGKGYQLLRAVKTGQAAAKSQEQIEADARRTAQLELTTAKLELQQTLAQTLAARNEENAKMRERIAVLEQTSATFREQYDNAIVREREKNERIENLVADLAQVREENSQLKRRLHGKERKEGQQQ